MKIDGRTSWICHIPVGLRYLVEVTVESVYFAALEFCASILNFDPKFQIRYHIHDT